MNTSSTIDWHARAADIRFDGRAVIAGQRIAAQDGQTFACISPLDGRTLTQVARGQAADIDAAVAAARHAFDDGRWAHKPPAVRKKCETVPRAHPTSRHFCGCSSFSASSSRSIFSFFLRDFL